MSRRFAAANQWNQANRLTIKGESIARQLDVEPRVPCCKCHSGNMCRVGPESKSSELCATDSNDSKISSA
jgi:hypothetical protein